MFSAIDHSLQTPYSDPGRFAGLIDAVPTDPVELSEVSRNLIVHYRASGHELPAFSRDDINSRWLERALAADQERHGRPFDAPRDLTQRVQGCCRDHTLFCVGVLRHHGIPARSRVGYAGYFVEGWNHDHVIVEFWDGERWRRFDSELDQGVPGNPTPMDMPRAEVDQRGFVPAAAAWIAYRTGDTDPDTYGIDPEVPLFHGPRFMLDEMLFEVAHRFGDELLLWDVWGRMGDITDPVTDDDAAWGDELASLLVASDDDPEAEQRLYRRYLSDADLRPGQLILQASPYGDPPVEVDLRERALP